MAKRRLTQRQRERIAHIQQRRRERLKHTETAAPDDTLGEPQEGRVVVCHGRTLVIASGAGTTACVARQNLGQIVCGDRVVWQPTGDEGGVVTALLPRSSTLSRPDYAGRDKPLAANLTRLVIVAAVAPEPSDYLIDQYLVAAEQIGVRAALALNKIDLLGPVEAARFLAQFAYYRKVGYPVIPVSARREHGLEPLERLLADETSILVGQSGVGKSSLVKALIPELEVEVGRLSAATGLGRHTTSATTLYRLPTGGELIDSPGVRSFRLGTIDRAGLERGFREFAPFLGRCRFANCAHDHEPGCALKKAVATGTIDSRRLDNFRHLLASVVSD